MLTNIYGKFYVPFEYTRDWRRRFAGKKYVAHHP
jgi:hypothetical protein